MPRGRRSAVKRKNTAEMANCYAVCLIGWEGPRPRAFGDNAGIWPVRIAVSRKEMMAAERSDIESPHVKVVVLEYVLVPTEVHAKRLKEKLDDVLMGEQESQLNASLRHRWRDVRGCFEEKDEHSRAIWWALVLEEAQRLLRSGATHFAVYGSWEEAMECEGE